MSERADERVLESVAGCAVLFAGFTGAAAQPTVSQLLNAREAAGAKAVVEAP